MGNTIEGFRQNGNSGHTYRIARRNAEPFSMEDLDDVKHYAIWRGHVALDGAIEPRPMTGDAGLIKVNPELSADEIGEIAQAGFTAESHPSL